MMFDVHSPTLIITRQLLFLLNDSIVILDLLLSQLNKVSSIISPIDICNLNVLSKLEAIVLDDIISTFMRNKIEMYGNFL